MKNKLKKMTATRFAICSLIILFVHSTFAASDLLQTKNRDIKFSSFLDTLDFSSQNTLVKIKNASTSIGLKIYVDDDYEAYWYPNENSSALAEGQVVSYYLGRYLNMAKLVSPSAYLSISGSTLSSFNQFITEDVELGINIFDPWQMNNLDNITKAVAVSIEQKKEHFGSIVKKMKVYEVLDDENLIDIKNETLFSNHPLAQYIKANGPHPSEEKIITPVGFWPKEGQVNISTESDLAKDLSKVLVLDMLSGQWDRFTGGNVEMYFDDSKENPNIGRLRFIARDNGGSSLTMYTDDPMFTKYYALVTRFSKKQIKRIKKLKKLLKEKPVFAKQLLRMKTDITQLEKRVAAILEHVEKQVELYGDDAYFN